MTRRRAVWYLRLRVPSDLQPLLTSHVVRSLKTGDRAVAQTRALAVAHRIWLTWDTVRMTTKPAEAKARIQLEVDAALGGKKINRPATANDIGAVAAHVFRLLLDGWERRRARRAADHPDFSPYHEDAALEAGEDVIPDETNGQVYTHHRVQEWAVFWERNQSATIQPALVRSARELGLTLDKEADFYPDLVREVLKFAYQAAVIDNERERGNYREIEALNHIAGRQLSSPVSAQSSSFSHPENESDRGRDKLTAEAKASWVSYAASFFEDRPALADKTLKSYRNAFDELQSVIGDKPIDDVTKKDIKKYANYLRDREITRNGATQLSRATIEKKISHVKSLFSWARANGEIPSDPSDGIEIREETKEEKENLDERRAFRNNELEKLFMSPMYTGCSSIHRRSRRGNGVYRDEKFWFFLTALLTGARTEELTFAPSELVILGGHPCINLRKSGTKTPAAPRIVPVLPDLQRLGFLDWVAKKKARGDEFLFQGGEAVADWSKFTNDYLDNIGLDDPEIVAYSTRHNFAQMLRAASLSKGTIQLIFGHALKREDQEMYGKEISVQEAETILRAVRSPIRLDHLIPSNPLR